MIESAAAMVGVFVGAVRSMLHVLFENPDARPGAAADRAAVEQATAIGLNPWPARGRAVNVGWRVVCPPLYSVTDR